MSIGIMGYIVPATEPGAAAGGLDVYQVEQRAEEAGVDLTAEHWQVIRFLHDYYHYEGEPLNARELVGALSGRFDAQGGRRYLSRLFPGGVVTQGCWIAGLRVPEYSRDASFGVAL